MKYLVSISEIAKAQSWPSYKETILRILEQKGAPIVGTFSLSVEPGVTVTQFVDLAAGDLEFEFFRPDEDPA